MLEIAQRPITEAGWAEAPGALGSEGIGTDLRG